MTVLESAAPVGRLSEAEYEIMLELLSEGSMHRSFNAYLDIDWDAPEFQVTGNDPRWILPTHDPLGSHPWYQAQPIDKQIEIGMYRQANIAKVGLLFEQILIRGFMTYLSNLPNNSAEFRYATHEVIEECNHTMMFQELVNRSGADVPGFGPFMRRLAPFLGLVAGPFPTIFFMGVLAGEEPIDHIQKTYLRSGAEYHPIITSVMSIHVAEEARHISFAHQFLHQRVAQRGPIGRLALSVVFPITMRVLCDAITVPPKQFWDEFDIPASVRKDLFWRSPEAKKTLADYFSDVRTLGDELGLMNPVSKLLWKVLKIDGGRSRYRSEPDRRR